MPGRRAILRAALAGLALSAPSALRAQPKSRVWRIGFLGSGSSTSPAHEGFRQGMRELGLVEGRNFVVEWRFADGDYARLPAMAAELVRQNVDIIVAATTLSVQAARKATTTTPIVMVAVPDPVGEGFAVSLSRPGGNITGLSIMMTETNVKLLELLKECVPKLARVAVVFDPATPSHGPGMKAVEAAGPALRLRIQPVAVRSAAEFDGAFSAIMRERADAVLVLSTPMFTAGARRLAELALTHKLPSLFGAGVHTEAGGLMSFGPDRADLWRRSAIYVDKILKGAKPGDLPIEQPTRFELVVNAKTAKALGIKIPNSILVRAEKVIE